MRGWTCLSAILAAVTIEVTSGQHAFQQHTASGLRPAQEASGEKNSTGNLIFWSVNSLLQHWPNTRYISGHTITAATVSPGTILYHGRMDDNQPKVLDWLATDPEHAFNFCHGRCYLNTYVATRSLRLAYFDGSSAAKVIPSGVMDMQDIVIWGEVRPDMTWNETVRIRDLCKWGERFKLDGFVRMEMSFEIMICDFNAGIELVVGSKIVVHTDNRIVRPQPPDPPLEVPPGWRGSLLSGVSSSFEILNSGMWHNRSPGETRVKIDYSRVVSFFDPALSSLVQARVGKPRDQFRLDRISEADSQYVRDQLTDIFTREGHGSGIDWGSLTQVIVDRYGGRLELLRHILQNPGSKRNVTERVAEARSQVLIMLTPYMLVSAIPPNPTGPVDRSWVNPVVKHCASIYTAWTPEHLLTPQEKVIRQAVEEVLLRICGILGDIWVDAFDSEESDVKELEGFLVKWELDIAKLIDWLEWSVWFKCDPVCGPEEICYIPTWPWGYLENEGGTVDMTPRCVEAVEPYTFLRHLIPGHRSS